MKINLSKIPMNGLTIEEAISLDKSLYQNANILDIQNVFIKGMVKYDYENNLVLNFTVDGSFLLEDSITLEPISYPFSCQIDETIENIEETCTNFYEKSKNILDISEILWENIVLEIPISATNVDHDKLNLRGEGWELKDETKKNIDPRLAKLTELLEKGKD